MQKNDTCSLLANIGDFNLPGTGIRVASFFSGGGGLDIGFHKAGFNIVFANDIEPLFCKTLEANKGNYFSQELHVSNKDIRLIESKELPSGIDLVIGGPPCQTFSASGRRAGGAAGRLDKRGNLFEAYCRLIREINPRAFLFENVRGILGTNKGKDWSEIVKAFSGIGYTISHRILDACDYGVPQQRERLFLVGHKLEHEFLFPEPTHGPDSPTLRPHLTPKEAFEGLTTNEDLHSLILSNGKYAPLLSLVPPGGNYLFFTAKRGYPEPVFAYRSRFSDFLYKADPNHTIKTLIASPGKYTGPFHWENRYFSIAEYKRLQGFPDDYDFCGTRSEVIRQIGNSVSPKIAEALALAIAKQIFNRKADVRLIPTDKRLSFDKRKGQKAKRTKEHHKTLISLRRNTEKNVFSFSDYNTRIEPTTYPGGLHNVKAKAEGKIVQLTIQGDETDKLFAKVNLEVSLVKQLTLFKSTEEQKEQIDAIIEVTLYGEGPHCIQTMWNSIDDLIIRSSAFHSLFELYGHFTEPHPIFSIVQFKTFASHPIAKFAEHTSDFNNCSRYFKNSHLLQMFGDAFGTKVFTELVEILRGYRFDIRCNETNVAIPKGIYMVAYPFTLPHRRQMNFSVRKSVWL
jgi:DNA (cytosine-5)-methyltransferase 1